MSEKTEVGDGQLDLLWGATQIGDAIGKPRRATFHLLEKGLIPYARKIGGQWCVSRNKLKTFFEEPVA